jgi:2-methylcitrate dehydratase
VACWHTGPEHVIDGKEGLAHCLGPDWKLDVLTEGLGDSWRITRCGMKAFPTEALTHTPISAVLDLVKEHDLKPDQVEKVQLRSLARAADILADPSKYDPQSKETADHSLPYVIAAAVAERQVTPLQFTPEKIQDPTIRAQLKKFERQLDYPKGDSRNPLSDQEIAEKFNALAEPILSEAARQKIMDTVWSLEKLDRVSGLMDALQADR